MIFNALTYLTLTLSSLPDFSITSCTVVSRLFPRDRFPLISPSLTGIRCSAPLQGALQLVFIRFIGAWQVQQAQKTFWSVVIIRWKGIIAISYLPTPSRSTDKDKGSLCLLLLSLRASSRPLFQASIAVATVRHDDLYSSSGFACYFCCKFTSQGSISFCGQGDSPSAETMVTSWTCTSRPYHQSPNRPQAKPI